MLIGVQNSVMISSHNCDCNLTAQYVKHSSPALHLNQQVTVLSSRLKSLFSISCDFDENVLYIIHHSSASTCCHCAVHDDFAAMSNLMPALLPDVHM